MIPSLNTKGQSPCQVVVCGWAHPNGIATTIRFVQRIFG
jgi:hypothetical protein